MGEGNLTNAPFYYIISLGGSIFQVLDFLAGLHEVYIPARCGMYFCFNIKEHTEGTHADFRPFCIYSAKLQESGLCLAVGNTAIDKLCTTCYSYLCQCVIRRRRRAQPTTVKLHSSANISNQKIGVR